MLAYLVIPFISAFIGYFTNYLAVRMLFNPKKPHNFLGLKIQGVLPRNKESIAQSIGKLVATKLLSLEDLVEALRGDQTSASIKGIIGEKIDDFLRNDITKKIPVIGMFLDSNLVEDIKNSILDKVYSDFEGNMGSILYNVGKSVNIEGIVTEKVRQFSYDQLEVVFYDLMKKEFRFIEVVGLGLGFFIGLLQVVFMLLVK